MSDRYVFLFFAIVLLPLGLYPIFNPRGTKLHNADGPYFRSGLANMPVWFFRVLGIVTMAMSAFFGYMFWTH